MVNELPSPPHRDASWIRQHVWDGAAVVLLIGAIWLVYSPSLQHLTAADQFDYLINTFGHDTTWDILAHTYSYNRTRIVGPGDTMCFRPLFFAWLAWQQAWYQTDLTAWQATGVVLHCVVCYLLFRILRLAGRARGPDSLAKLLMAWLVTLFFALNPNVTVMVVWTHINPYMVFMIFALVAIELLLREVLDETPDRRRSTVRIGAAWMLLCAATFTYELGQFLAVLAGLYLGRMIAAREGRRRGIETLAAFASIALMYQAVNWMDQQIHAGQYTPDLDVATIFQRALSWDTLDHCRRLGLYALVQPFFTKYVYAYMQARIEVRELDWLWVRFNVWTLAAGMVLGFAGLLCVFSFWRRSASRARHLAGAAAMILGLLLVYLAIIVLGRMNIRPGKLILQRNSYYTYIPLLWMLLGVGLWCAAREQRRARLLYLGLAIPLGLLTCYNGVVTYRMNDIFADPLSLRARIDRIEALIEEQRNVPGFGLAFDSDDEGRQKGLPFLCAYFHRYEDNYNPSHVVVWRLHDFTILKIDDYLREYRSGSSSPESSGLDTAPRHAQRPLPEKVERPLFPDVVKIGPKYHILYFAGKYQAVIYDDGVWHLAPEADTIAKAEAEAWRDLNPPEEEVLPNALPERG